MNHPSEHRHPSVTDIRFMRRACALARRGEGHTAPNPVVGAVVVREGRIVGQGFHERAGGPHAEARALREAGSLAEGATLYVTLEPCNHHGRTPPCTAAVIESGIKRVVIATSDPNPAVCGGGAERLRAAGIEVETGVLSEWATELNRGWERWVRTKLPFVTLKVALSLDGRVAAERGQQTQITGAVAQRVVHRLRRSHQAVLVGVNTVLLDNPALTNRSGQGGQPVKVILDTNLRTPFNRRLFEGAGSVLIATTRVELATPHPPNLALVTVPPAAAGGVDLPAVLRELGALGIQSILCEGGATVGGALLHAGLVNRVVLHYAPTVFGAAATGPRLFDGVQALPRPLRCVATRRLGRDIEVVLEPESEQETE